jgi:hypothetical protein
LETFLGLTNGHQTEIYTGKPGEKFVLPNLKSFLLTMTGLLSALPKRYCTPAFTSA